MKYFGKFPIGNIIISNIIFASVRFRIASLRFKNKIKRFVKSANWQITNDAASAEVFLQFKHQGYDKLNIGGGRKNLEGFVNIDFVSHPNVEREIKANILDLSFIPDESVIHIHSSHVVEHLTHEQLCKQLLECYRILKESGLLTIRCPNALGVCYGFWFKVVPETGQDEFIALGYPADEEFYDLLNNWYHRDFHGFLHWLYGDVGNVENEHLNILTPSKLKSAVESAGFTVLKMTEPEATNIILVARKR